MKVLFIAQPFPYPPDTGSRNLIFHWLDAASRLHDIHLLWIGDPQKGTSSIRELPKLKVTCIAAVPDMKLSARIRRLATAVLTNTPSTSLVGMTNGARNEILHHVETGNYDVVVLTENVVAGYAPLLVSSIPVVLFKHSVQAVDARDARNRFGKLHLRWALEEHIVRKFEARTCETSTVLCTVNAEDAADLAERYRLPRPARVVPIGVDLSKFPPRGQDPGGHVIGFFGNMSWGANLDAANWFVAQILPTIWEKFPSAEFRVIGHGSKNWAPEKCDPRIDRRGPSNIPDCMSDAVIGVVPVFSGTGVRLKLLEMLSMGIPVITTSLGALGTGCKHEEHVLIADDCDSFSAAVVRLIEDSRLRKKLRGAGLELIQAHSWQSFYPEILEAIQKAASTHPGFVAREPTSAAQEIL
jgi:glycosyltransferase involved in cell wall biosynthesis